uniref:Uncharacterized protein n=1 Tax=Cutibacterium granulosum DSM 20700 TaxID=1160719 RepID=A0A9X5LV84_9ACTN
MILDQADPLTILTQAALIQTALGRVSRDEVAQWTRGATSPGQQCGRSSNADDLRPHGIIGPTSVLDWHQPRDGRVP